MTVRNLDALFNPKSIAVIGASLRAGSIGEMVWSRLSAANFAGPVWAVNPKHRQLNGAAVLRASTTCLIRRPWPCCARHRPTWPGIVSQLGARGTRAVVIIGQAGEPEGRDWTRRTLAAARPSLLRVVGLRVSA